MGVNPAQCLTNEGDVFGLPTGVSLCPAIEAVDDATGNGLAYYMINCAHPTHFNQAVAYADTQYAKEY